MARVPDERRTDVLRLSRKLTVGVLLVTAGFLLVMSVIVKSIQVGWGHDYLFGLNRLFWVDEEANLPTWFSSFLLLCVSVCLVLIAAARHRARGTFTLHWATLALLFLVLAIDEVAGVHEISARYAARAGGVGVFKGDAASFAWVLFALPLAVGIWLFYWRFVRGLPLPVRRRMAWGAAAFATGVLGVEALTGALVGLQPNTWGYLVLATVEEGFEMVGAVIFLDAVLLQLRDDIGAVSVRVT